MKFCKGCNKLKSLSDFNKRSGQVKDTNEQYRSRCKTCCLSQSRKNNLKNPKSSKEAAWRFRGIDITFEDYQSLFISQAGLCKICKKEEVGRLLPVDHDHLTLKVRGLLCTSCNTKLGWFEAYADQIIDYLGGGLSAIQNCKAE